MRLIDADKLPYEDIESINGNTYMCVNAYDIEHAPTIKQSEDCISREEVRQLICKNNDEYGYSNRFHEFTEECLKLPSVTPQTRWIPVSERLPEEEDLYIVSVKNDHDRRYSKTCWFHGNGNWFSRQDVEAWMPLPESYNAEKDVNCTDLCKSCNTKGCIFQSGIVRSHCDFYKTESKEQESVLDKIRAEIEQNAYPIVHGVNNHEKGMTLYGILQIIDKYSEESEENDT